MGDIEIYYASLNSASSALTTAASDLVLQAAELSGEDVGVENPDERPSLRLEMARRLGALHESTGLRVGEADDIASRFTKIANDYSNLDRALTGSEQG